jgi:glyoxylase-like metal-dependent hydrolase (beta-lactamase superfamily II)
MMASIQIGDIELFALSDGYFRLDGGAMFGVIPKTMWEKRAAPDERNRILMGVRPLLIRAGGQWLLVDAGIGDKMPAKLADIYAFDRTHALDQSLAGVGLTPDDIHAVIATHLHFDHAGGFTVAGAGALRPKFPAARYLVRRGEWEDAVHPNERNQASYLKENLMPLQEAGVLDLHDQDGELFPGISVWRTGGHTMHHQILRIESRGRVAIFAADLLPTVAHIDLPWIMGYDLYPMDTLAYKRTFVREAIDREYVIFFEHDPAVVAGIIREKNGKPFIEPVIVN